MQMATDTLPVHDGSCANIDGPGPGNAQGFEPRVVEFHQAAKLTNAQLRAAVFESKVLILKNAPRNVDDYVMFMSRLGAPVNHMLGEFAHPRHRSVTRVSNYYRDGLPTGIHNGGTYWHTDMSYRPTPTVFTSLACRRVPGVPAGTEFIDCEHGLRLLEQRLAGEPTTAPMTRLVLGELLVYHEFGNRDASGELNPGTQQLSTDSNSDSANRVLHPLVYTHPFSRRKSIYGLAATARIIEGLPVGDSVEILDTILRRILKIAPRYIHDYHEGDILIWDNLTTMHRGQATPKSYDADNCRLLYRMNVDYAANCDIKESL